MSRVIDGDTHFIEPFSIWEDHIEPRHRDRALRVERDEKGWPWLAHQGRRLWVIDQHTPGRVDLFGEQRRRFDAGLPWQPAEVPIPDPWDPGERIAHMDALGVDAALVFPNLGLTWERELSHDLVSHTANLEAYNRWLVDLLPACRDRLYPVAHLTLRDLEWFERELRRCARAGLRSAMIPAQQAGGRALAHPDLDRVWALFQELDISVMFHVASDQLPLHPCWYELDPEPGNKVMETAFLYVAPAVAVSSLILHGKLEQFPRLRIGITELSAGWVPGFLLQLDGAFEFYRRQNGKPLTEMPLRPSDYFRRQVRVNAFPMEGAPRLAKFAGAPIFSWGSDYPHAEGMAVPSWKEYLAQQQGELRPDELAALSGGNAGFLLGEA